MRRKRFHGIWEQRKTLQRNTEKRCLACAENGAGESQKTKDGGSGRGRKERGREGGKQAFLFILSPFLPLSLALFFELKFFAPEPHINV